MTKLTTKQIEALKLLAIAPAAVIRDIAKFNRGAGATLNRNLINKLYELGCITVYGRDKDRNPLGYSITQAGAAALAAGSVPVITVKHRHKFAPGYDTCSGAGCNAMRCDYRPTGGRIRPRCKKVSIEGTRFCREHSQK